MTKLTGGTVVQNPQTLEPVFLAAGSDLPEWAEGLVGDHLLDQPAAQDDSAYAGLKVDELKAEIAKRNEGRDDAAKLSDAGRKPELVAALEADDQANSGS